MYNVFSVIVPIYKVEKYLNKCIDSILRQSFPNFELILVDDGSPDNCSRICDEYSKKDSRVKVIHKQNGGLVSARNTGLHEATGEYVIYVDGDDWLADGALQVFWEKAIEKYEPDMVVYNMTRVYGDRQEKDPIFVKEGFYDNERLIREIKPYMMYDYRLNFYHGLLFPSCGGKIIKRDILLSHYCTDEEIRMGEDNAFIFECLYYSKSVFFCDDYLYMYNHLNVGSIRSNYDEDRFNNNERLIKYIENHLGGKEEYLDYQINVFKVYWLIMAVFHEVKCKRRLLTSRSHIHDKIIETNALKGIDIYNLPISARAFYFLLKLQLFGCALIGARIINTIRKQ